ncbi:Circadian input kinase A [Acidisarcina polymorpha]|uniref:histidine kinase n=1 Tax=Acidisarcina polymorpha TaxID=2211140 RepID=A0A2Z5G788_9BACT|nr:PAS domain S-box protein [Acidisarcina polymorpha]AXC14535.1 Circadian input kinase A [Acidisarcina polymorpha]
MFFSSGSDTPYGHYYLWDPGLVWLHVISDALIALSYLSIPFTLAYFVVKRRDLPFHWMFVCFGIFILAGSSTHAMGVWTLWHADYWLSGSIKAITAIASVITAILLVRLVPHAVALPSPALLRFEIAERSGAEKELSRANAELERRVEARTAELKKLNEDLVLEIGERKRIEQTLRKSEEQLRLAQQASGLGLWDWDPRTDRAVWSDQTFRIFGLEPDNQKLDEARFVALIYPGDRTAVKLAIREALRPGGEFDAEYRMQRQDGQLRWLLSKGRTHCDAAGQPFRMIGLTLDVTERRQAAEDLRRSDERFRLLVDSITDYAIFMLDSAGFVTSWNTGAERLKGYQAQEIIGQHFSCFYCDEDLRKGEPAMALREAAAAGRYEANGWRLRKDGTRFQANAILTALQDEKGALIGFAKITRDLTESRLAEEAVQAAHDELARVVRASTLGALTASIAHEINQPLAAIVNNANAARRILANPESDLEEVQQAVIDIAEAGTRAAEIISHIRSLLKKNAPQKSLLDINQVIREVLALTTGVLKKQHISLRTELRTELPPVLGDRVQLQQVLLNLIMNGIEAMNAILDRPRVLVIRSERRELGLEVAVKDYGTGLDPQHLERIFDTFFTTKASGMGMGLSISRSIIEAHNGRLWASRDPATHGATFHFSLPGMA